MNQTIFYIFFTFLKLGATAFGGYMSLVAMVQKQLVDLDKKLKEEDLLDGITLTSVLPGPVAVNVIAYVGYRLKGIGGAIAAFTGIILPSFCLVIGLSGLYFNYGDVPVVKNVFMGITPAVTALILTVAWGMARKTMREAAQWIIGAGAAFLLAVVGGFGLTVGVIFGSGVAGFFLFRDTSGGTERPVERGYKEGKEKTFGKRRLSDYWKRGVGAGIPLLLAVGLLLWIGQKGTEKIGWQIVSTFAGTSLTLFGGGYVVIPALHELFVEHLHWLTSAEFADGIAIGQITPGPIFITATFIGYKVGGIGGAMLATLAMFVPPAVLTVFLSHLVGLLGRSRVVKAVMKGVRAAVIGLIFASAYTIGQTMAFTWPAAAIFFITFILSFKYTISPVYLILGAGTAGFILF